MSTNIYHGYSNIPPKALQTSTWHYDGNLSVYNKSNKAIPLSKAMRNSRFRCSSFMNSSFCRNKAMRSSSRYCFSFLSCSVTPAVKHEPLVVCAVPDQEPDWAAHWLTEETEADDDGEGWDELLWELWSSNDRKYIYYNVNSLTVYTWHFERTLKRSTLCCTWWWWKTWE